MKDTSKTSLRRGHNEGNIRQRTDGRWEVRLSAGIDYKTGKPRRTSTCCNTRQEAIAILQLQAHEVRTQGWRDPMSVTLGEWYEYWLNTYMKDTVKQSTYASYRSYLNKHFCVLGKILLKKLEPHTLQEFYNYKFREEGLSPKTLRNYHMALHKCLQQAVKERLLIYNPCDAVTLPSGEKPEISVFTNDQQRALVQASYRHRYGVFIRLDLCTGLRMLTTKDNVIICDPEDEYSPLVNRLGGQVIRLSPNSRDYVNPLDINLNYSEEENPLALKSDFVLSFCELIMGSKTGLEAIEKTVIDRAVQMIYQPYFADPRPENMPVLGDLLNALMAQGIPEAERVAQALDLYVNGSLNFFNHRTTVDIRNRLVCFDIKGLGKNLKKPGMLIVQDAVWNTVTVNRSIGRATWYFVDEFHLLLKEEQTAAYSAEIWKRFRKWGGVPTGATQNPKDLLSSPEIENILENSDFIYLLNLSAGDRKLMTERLNISAEQLAYVTNADPGNGLLFFQNVILPFRDEFPKDTELYKLLTTKPGEVAHDGESG